MTLQELNTQLTSLLKSYIKSKGYVSSGKLVNSIQFTATDSNELDISFNAQNYILYLEKGKLMQNFFDSSDAIELITQYEISKIESKFKV